MSGVSEAVHLARMRTPKSASAWGSADTARWLLWSLISCLSLFSSQLAGPPNLQTLPDFSIATEPSTGLRTEAGLGNTFWFKEEASLCPFIVGAM